MWQRWRRFGPIGWALVVLIGIGVFQFVKEQNAPKEIEAVLNEQPVIQPTALDVAPPAQSASSNDDYEPATPSVPPTATIDGVTYTGEQQIDALTQAARDAGLDEATAQSTGGKQLLFVTVTRIVFDNAPNQ